MGMDAKKALEVTRLIARLIHNPQGKAAEGTGNPILPDEFVQLNWRLIFGDTPDDKGLPGMVMILGVYRNQPLITWQARDCSPKLVVDLLLTALSLVGDRAGVDLKDLAIKTLQEVKEREALERATDGQDVH